MPLDVDNALIGDWSGASDGTGNNPLPGDTRREGDDQIRRAKATIRRHFPNFTGTQAAPKTVNATDDELNSLVGVSQTPGDKIVTLPGGNTVPMLFYLEVAPLGWSINITLDEQAVRTTKGLANGGIQGGTSGGNNTFTAQFADHAEDAVLGVGSKVLDETQMPSHTHADSGHSHGFFIQDNTQGNQFLGINNYFAQADSGNDFPARADTNAFNGVMIRNASAIIQPTGGGLGHSHTKDDRVQWAACIVASLD